MNDDQTLVLDCPATSPIAEPPVTRRVLHINPNIEIENFSDEPVVATIHYGGMVIEETVSAENLKRIVFEHKGTKIRIVIKRKEKS